MTIDRIGHVEPVSPTRKQGRNVQLTGGDEKADSINLSADAVKKSEIYQVVELIKATPDLLDEARIAEHRQKLDDPEYMNEKIIGVTADNILSAWFA
jgi:hypothetical protein